MKKIFLPLLSFTLLFTVACNDNAETTDKSETSTEAKKDASTADEETTDIDLGPTGVGVNTKSGTSVKVGSEGVSVGTKDVNIKVGEKDTIPK